MRNNLKILAFLILTNFILLPKVYAEVTPEAIIATLANVPTSCYTKSFGDANCDGLVNSSDFVIWQVNLADKNVPIVYSDFFPDGKISLVDFEIWRRYSNGAIIPTPTIALSPFCTTVSNNIGTNSQSPNWTSIRQYDVDNNGIINSFDVTSCISSNL